MKYYSLASILLITGVFAGSDMHRGTAPILTERLDLSPGQQEQIETLRFEHKQEMIDLKADLEKAQLRMRRMRDQDGNDRRKLEDQYDRVANKRIQIQKKRFGHQLDVRGTLNSEQREKFDRFNKRMKREKRQHRCDEFQHDGRCTKGRHGHGKDSREGQQRQGEQNGDRRPDGGRPPRDGN